MCPDDPAEAPERDDAPEPDEASAFGRRPPQLDAFALAVRSGVREALFGRHRAEPHRWGRYVRLDRIGEGGMGLVYAVYDTSLRRRVALKVLRPELLGPQAARARARLVREAQAMARISHPNIAAVYEVVEDGDDVCIAMELLEGTSVAEWTGEKKPAWREAVDAFIAAGRGLAAIHRAGLVHRDIKPANVVVTRDGRACIVDFGLARGPAPDTPDGVPEPPTVAGPVVTVDGLLPGTPRYMAPEQHRGEQVDARSDQYSFCATLFEALAGSAAFPQRRHTALYAAKEEERVAWQELPNVPRRIRAVLERGLQSDPAARYPSMDAVVDELERGARRWSPALLVAAATLVVVAVAFFFGGRAVVSDPCQTDLATGWTEDQRARIHGAFAATSHPHAQEAWRHTAAALDRYVEQLRRTRSEACAGASDGVSRSARLACIDSRVRDLAALLGALESIGHDEVSRAVDVAHAAAPPSECLGVAATEIEDADLMDRLAAARAVGALGRREEALAQLEAIVADARGRGSSRVEAEGLLAAAALGGVDFTARIERLHEAWAAALLRGDDRIVATVLVDLVGVLGSAGRHEDAMLTAGIANAAVARAGGVALLRLELQTNVAASHLAAADFAAAEPVFEEALALLQEDVPDAGGVDIRLRHGLANAHAGLGRLDQAHDEFDAVVAAARETLGPRHPLVADVLNDQAIVSTSAQRLEDALAEFEASLDVTEATFGARSVEWAKTYGNIVMLRAKMGAETEETIAGLTRVEALFLDLLGADHLLSAITSCNIGFYELQRGRSAETVKRCRAAARTIQSVAGSDAPALAEALTRLGHAYLAEDEPQLAREVLERATRHLLPGQGFADEAFTALEEARRRAP